MRKQATLRSLRENRVLVDAILLLLLSFAIYVLLMRYAVLFQDGQVQWNAFATGNELAHFELVRAVVEGGTFTIDDFMPAGTLAGDIAHYNGHFYSNKPPGFAFLSVPGYALFYYLVLPLVSSRAVPDFLPWISALCAAMTVALAYVMAIDLGAKRTTAAVCALVSGLATIMTVYAVSSMNHTASALFLMLALWSGFRYRRSAQGEYLLLCTFSMGYSLLISNAMVVPLVSLNIYLLWNLWGHWRAHGWKGHVLSAVLVGALPLLLLAYYNYRCFGNPLSSGYNHYIPPSYVEFESPSEAYLGGSFWTGLWGLFFSGAKGVFVYTPILLCAIPGAYFLFRGRKLATETAVLVATVGLNVILFAPYRFWFGGHSLGARHILPVLPLLAVLTYPCLQRLSRWGKWIAGGLIASSIGVHIILATLAHDREVLAFTWIEEEGYVLTSLYNEILPFFTHVEIDLIGNGLFRVAKLGSLLLAFGIASYLGWRLSERRDAL